MRNPTRSLRIARGVALGLAGIALAVEVPSAAQRGPVSSGVVVSAPQVPVGLGPLPDGPGKVIGRVIDRETNQAISGVTIVIRQLGEPTGRSTRAVNSGGRIVTADANGAFVIDHLPFGDFVVSALAAGYSSGGAISISTSNKQIRLSEAQPSAATAFEFSKLGAISGTVFGDDGKPVADVAVRLLQGMAPFLRPVPVTAVTDASGTYRFTSVPSGEYAISVYARSITIPNTVSEMYRLALQRSAEIDLIAPRLADSEAPVPRPLPPGLGVTLGAFQLSIEDAQSRLRPVTIDASGSVRTVPITYQPDLTSLADVTPVHLSPAEQRVGLDIRVRAQPAVRVSGTLTGPVDEVSYVGVHLIAAGMERFYRTLNGEAAVTVSDASGRFTFLGIAPGQYTIEMHRMPYPPSDAQPAASTATTPLIALPQRRLERWARMPVTVGQTDVSDLTLPVHAPLFVRGRIELDDAGASSPARPASGSVRLSLEPQTGQRITFPTTSVTPGEAFALGPIFPDTYLLRIQLLAVGRVISITADGKELVNQSLVLSDRDQTGVIIKLALPRASAFDSLGLLSRPIVK